MILIDKKDTHFKQSNREKISSIILGVDLWNFSRQVKDSRLEISK